MLPNALGAVLRPAVTVALANAPFSGFPARAARWDGNNNPQHRVVRDAARADGDSGEADLVGGTKAFATRQAFGKMSTAAEKAADPLAGGSGKAAAAPSAATPLVDDLLLSLGKHVHVRDRDRVEGLLRRLRSGGASRLQVVADFDHTLTRVHRDGRRLDCSWGVMENSSLLPEEYVTKTNAIKAKYLPIEQDPHLTVEEKVPHMVEWYTRANGLLRELGVNRSMFPEMVRASDVEFREGTGAMMAALRAADVPVLILSAGLGDLLVEILTQAGLLPSDNVKVVSNFMSFDQAGRVTGIDGEMIHVFNKSESAVHDSEYFRRLEHRHNIVLLGDSLGDLQMASGVDKVEALLTVGFLNSRVEERLEQYCRAYDVVLVDDQTMAAPAAVVAAVLAGKEE